MDDPYPWLWPHQYTWTNRLQYGHSSHGLVVGLLVGLAGRWAHDNEGEDDEDDEEQSDRHGQMAHPTAGQTTAGDG